MARKGKGLSKSKSTIIKTIRRTAAKVARRVDKKRSQKMTSWSVYLIISSQLPKTYVGVTTDFFRRLKQHNGELKGGAKASSAGRPWTCACIIQGFKDQSEACMFESKWKSITRSLPRKRKVEGIEADDAGASLQLLKHRKAALDRVQGYVDCSHLQIDWQQDPS